MRATYVIPELTPATPEHVSRAYRTALTNLVGAPSDEAVAVLHAHGALETGHFKSCWNHNAGNIKASDRYDGFFTCITLNEVLNGKLVWFAPEGEFASKDGPVVGRAWPVPDGHPQTRMRAYAVLADGVADKVRFLTGGRWERALRAALAGNPALYCDELKAQVYFTAALEPYRRAVVQLTAKYLPVARATAAMQPAPPLPPDDDALCRDMAACFRFELPPELAARVRIGQAEHVDFALDLVRADRDRDIQGGD